MNIIMVTTAQIRRMHQSLWPRQYYKQVEEILLHCDDTISRTGIRTRRLNSEYAMKQSYLMKDTIETHPFTY